MGEPSARGAGSAGRRSRSSRNPTGGSGALGSNVCGGGDGFPRPERPHYYGRRRAPDADHPTPRRGLVRAFQVPRMRRPGHGRVCSAQRTPVALGQPLALQSSGMAETQPHFHIWTRCGRIFSLLERRYNTKQAALQAATKLRPDAADRMVRACVECPTTKPSKRRQPRWGGNRSPARGAVRPAGRRGPRGAGRRARGRPGRGLRKAPDPKKGGMTVDQARAVVGL